MLIAGLLKRDWIHQGSSDQLSNECKADALPPATTAGWDVVVVRKMTAFPYSTRKSDVGVGFVKIFNLYFWLGLLWDNVEFFS